MTTEAETGEMGPQAKELATTRSWKTQKDTTLLPILLKKVRPRDSLILNFWPQRT